MFNFMVLFQHTNFRLRAEHLTMIPRVTSPEKTLALHQTSGEGHVDSFSLSYKGTVPPSHRPAQATSEEA